MLVRSSDVATRFAEGQWFRMTLRAMPSVKTAGKRRSIGAARSKDSLRLRWIHARASEHGFRLLSDPEMRVERVRLEEAKIRFAFNACIYRAPIRITEPEKFTRAYVRGLGSDREGFHSIRINTKWRLCFRFADGNAYDGAGTIAPTRDSNVHRRAVHARLVEPAHVPSFPPRCNDTGTRTALDRTAP